MKSSNVSREDLERLNKYIQSIAQGKSHIDAALEKKLVAQYKTGKPLERKEALDTLISYNIAIFANIAISVINSMKGGYNIDPLDLMQLGTIVYMSKLETWDETKKAKMITYYYRDMKTKMQRFIMSHAFQIRQGSVFIQHLSYNISKINQRYLQETGELATDEVLAKELDIKIETIKYCKRIASMSTTSLEEMATLYKIAVVDAHEQDVFDPITSLIFSLNKRIGGSDELFIELITCLDDKKNLPEHLLKKLKE